MSKAVPAKRKRDLAIQAAIDRIVIAIHPGISHREMQDRGGMLIWPDRYTVQLDGEPIIEIELEGKRSFRLTLL